jgi:hypothetical protein
VQWVLELIFDLVLPGSSRNWDQRVQIPINKLRLAIGAPSFQNSSIHTTAHCKRQSPLSLTLQGTLAFSHRDPISNNKRGQCHVWAFSKKNVLHWCLIITDRNMQIALSLRTRSLSSLNLKRLAPVDHRHFFPISKSTFLVFILSLMAGVRKPHSPWWPTLRRLQHVSLHCSEPTLKCHNFSQALKTPPLLCCNVPLKIVFWARYSRLFL